MERNVVSFPGPEERERRAREREREDARVNGKLSEAFPPLDIAKLADIRRIVTEVRESEAAPYRFGADKIEEARAEVEILTPSAVMKEIQTATEDMVRADPVRHLMLVEFIESRIPTSQDDE